MKITNVRSTAALTNDRLDAHFFTSPGVAASEQIASLHAEGIAIESLGELGRVWDPPRFARAYAASAEDGIPYLRPYDVFDYVPQPKDRLSIGRNADVEGLVPDEGTILQTCSGRNLGPVTYTDEHLARFALSHDMIRIQISDPEMRFYVLAFLKTSIGQALLRRGKSGSVIDHVTTYDVAAVPVPIMQAGVIEAVSKLARESVEAAQSARSSVNAVLTELDIWLPPPVARESRVRGWTVQSTSLRGRLDAAFYDPAVSRARNQIAGSPSVRCGDIAEAALPVRYKRYYVDGGNGRPILSGRQLLQLEPVNLRYVADRSFRDTSEYEVTAGMTIFGAVGRSEGRQGAAALVTSDRDGWLASNDVMRLKPRSGVRPGALWLAMTAQQTRLQVNALSFGSVIDHLTPEAVEDILVPDITEAMAIDAEEAWSEFSKSHDLMVEAVATLEAALVGNR